MSTKRIPPLNTDIRVSYTNLGSDEKPTNIEVEVTNDVHANPPIDLPDQVLEQFELERKLADKQHQLSLDLFARDVPVVDINKEIALKKNNFHIRVNGGLKLLERKLLNALYFVARPNVLHTDVHVVDLDYLKWLVDHNVGDSTYLKKTLTNIQKVLVQIDRTVIEPEKVLAIGKGGKKKEPKQIDQYFSTPFIYDVAFDSLSNTLCFRIPESLRKSLALPSQYTWISLRISAAFQGKHSLALYEILHSWKWRGESEWLTLEEFRKMMGIAEDEYTVFKRLSERVIQESLAEIAELSDIKASVEYRRVDRKVAAMKFKIDDNPEGKMNLRDMSQDVLIPHDLFKELRDDWLLSPAAIKELGMTYSAEKIREKIQVLRFRYLRNGKQISHRRSLLLASLEKDDEYRLAPEEIEILRKEKEAASARASQEALRNAQLQRERKGADDAMQKFDACWDGVGEQEKFELWKEYIESPASALAKALKIKPTVIDLSKEAVKREFAGWLHKKNSFDKNT